MQTKNLQITPNGVMPRINASQYDNGREVHFLLYDGSSPYTIPAGADVRVEGAKSDGNGFSYACTYSGNNVTVIIRTQMTVLAEDVVCELRVSIGDTDIGTLNFVLAVEKGALLDDIPISDTEIPAIIELARAEQYNAEAWAQGTKDGVPVPSTDPTYHNNAKYWAEHSQGGSFANLSDVDVTNPLNGQVPVYNSTTEKWENQNASGGLLPHFKIHSEHESVVTVTYPDGVTTVTATETSSGLFECDVTEFGVYTIDAILSGDDAQAHQAVDTVMIYEIHDEHFSYALSVFAPSGSTIRVTATGESYTGTGQGSTAEVFSLHQASTTYTIQVKIDGLSKSTTKTSAATTGQSGSVTVEFGTINVTLDSDFIGETITCTKGALSISKVASSTSMVFYPSEVGTWTVAVDGTSTSAEAEVVDLNTPVSVALSSIQTITVTLYSATEDTVTFTDASGVQKTEVFASGQSSKSIDIEIDSSGSTITFTSSVAKNPDNLSQDYSKTFTITTSTTEIYLMPDAVKTLYWYGYSSSNLETLSTTNGWSRTTLGFIAPTYNAQNIYVSVPANNYALSGIGGKNAISGTTIKCITNFTGANGQISGAPDKNTQNSQLVNKIISAGLSLTSNDISSLSTKYISMGVSAGTSGNIYAFWYE